MQENAFVNRKSVKGAAFAASLVNAKPSVFLVDHLIETGKVTKFLLENTIFSSLLEHFSNVLDIDRDVLKSNICFLVAVHDIGKAHPVFQLKLNGSALDSLIEEGYIVTIPTDLASYHFRHEEFSKVIIKDYLRNEYGMSKYDSEILSSVIANHHQNKQSTERYAMNAWCGSTKEKWSDDIITPIMRHIANVFPFTPFEITTQTDAFAHFLLGLLIVADRIASSDYKTKHLEEEIGKIKYTDPTFFTMFPEFEQYNYSLRPIQETVLAVIEENPDADLLLIEASMGQGKTEPGEAAVAKLMESHGKQGIYFALPTEATAESMLPRFESAMVNAGYIKPGNVSLATGSSWLSDLGNDLDLQSISRTKLTAPFAIGTIDQIMSAVEQLRFYDVRIAFLSTKAILIDEMHSYDAYMMAQIKVLLQYCKAYNVPVVMLSATMSDQLKEEILQIYDSSFTRDELKQSYPLVTAVVNGEVKQYECAEEEKKHIHLSFAPYYMNTDKIAKLALETTKDGGITLVVQNIVDRAGDVYRKITELNDQDCDVYLITARLTPAQKDRLTKKIIRRMGKAGRKNGERPKRAIVVATQIIEQSMDVDFDSIITDIAPLDYLLQRLGRWMRHDSKGTIRENPDYKPVAIVLVPEYMKKLEFASVPYNSAVLTSSAKVIKKNSSFTIPNDIRRLINETYDNAGEGWRNDQMNDSFLGTAVTIESPSDFTYTHNAAWEQSIQSKTRQEKYTTYKTIFLDDNKVTGISQAKMRDLIYNRSVPLPAYKLPETFSEIAENEQYWYSNYLLLSAEMQERYKIRLDDVFGFILE